MKLFELADEDAQTAYYDPNADKINGRNLGDTRKPKLTLRALNRLKKMRAMRKLENLKRQDLLDIMYGQPDEQAGGMGGGMGF